MFPDAAPTVLDVLPHCSSIPRGEWAGADDDERPLSERGFQEAAVLAVLAAEGVEAVYTSPSARCRQSVEPLAAAAGAPITIDERLREARGFVEPKAWTEGTFAPVSQALGGAWAAGRGMGVVDELLTRHNGGHVVLCSHGDLIPAVLVHLAAAFECPLPRIVGRGGWFRLRFEAGRLSMTGIHPDDETTAAQPSRV